MTSNGMKFSIVTPTFNSEKYLRETIESVLSQKGDFEIEYIIQDGGSEDKTLDIIKFYEEKLLSGVYPIRCKNITFKWFSNKDDGMYDAINKGFARATGKIYAWLNSDDLYMPNALEKIRKVFEKFPEIEWLKGITSYIEGDSEIPETGSCYIYNQNWIRKGVYGINAYFIHQDSVFWRRKLWEKVGGIDTQYRLAGDYYLWLEFSKHAPLWSVNTPVSYFRKWKGQQTYSMKEYRKEQKSILGRKEAGNIIIRLFFWLRPKFRNPSSNLFLNVLYRILFHGRNKRYIDLDEENNPIIKETFAYKV